MSKVLSKILNKNKILKKQYNFCKNMISLEVRDMKSEAEFLRKRKFQGNNQYYPCQTKISVEAHGM